MKKNILLLIILISSLLLPAAGTAGGLLGDFDHDFDVDGDDLIVFSRNFGTGTVKCMENSDCPADSSLEPGYYCAKKAGSCDDPGHCAPRPDGCYDLWDPVCGCDGRTYSNACYAASAGVNVDYSGECIYGEFELDIPFKIRVEQTMHNPAENIAVKFVRVESDNRCPSDAVCVWEGNAAAAFTFYKDNAASRTFILNTGIEPRMITVFGYAIELKGLYPLPSLAGSPLPGQYVAGLLITRSETPCKDNLDCSKSDYCAKAAEDCDGEGVCLERPTICPLYWDPVCGCDGRTYGNACEAAAAGVSIFKKGPCRDTRCDDGTDVLCKMLPPICEKHEILAVQDHCWICVDPETCRPPRDTRCDDGTEVLCDMIPPECEASEILAVQNNCWLCVDPDTCRPPRDTSCDDGSVPVCLMVPPVCENFEILAAQNGCWVCVNPATCLPWGDPNCKPGAEDCPEGFVCDPCGTSSCPGCENCVPACVPLY